MTFRLACRPCEFQPRRDFWSMLYCLCGQEDPNPSFWMELSRRQFLEGCLISAGVLGTGCKSGQRGSLSALPAPAWPAVGPPRHEEVTIVNADSPVPQTHIPVNHVPVPPAAESSARMVGAGALTGLYSRAWWTSVPAIGRRVQPLGRVDRITVHHEGWQPVTFSDATSTRDRLNRIHKFHTGPQRGWGDIGYHFVIDRAGRLIQARDLQWQGAHVRNHNEHNIGIMVLGNFDVQTPSRAQHKRVHQTLRKLTAMYRVPVNRVHTHREFRDANTSCPGRHLQGWMVKLRRGSALT